MSFISDAMGRIKPSPTIAMSNKAKTLKESGVDVIDFSLGEPDFPTPDFILNATKEGLDKGLTKYTVVDGMLSLKKAICGKFQKENNLTFDVSDITVCCGAKQVIFNAIAATVNDGDEVIIPTPSWVSYFDIVSMFGGKPVSVETTMQENFCITEEKLDKAVTSKTKWLIINSPSNPTGAVYSEENLRGIINVMKKYPNLHLMTDDIYEHILYDGVKFLNILNIAPELSERVLIVNGVSKSYCMTGYRIGYGATKNKNLLASIKMIQSQSTSNATSFAQYAAQIALESEESRGFIKIMNERMTERMNFVYEELFKIEGIKPSRPQGAFYVFSSIEDLIGKKMQDGRVISSGGDFCNLLLEKQYVATVQGEAFGCKNHFRLSFSADLETLKDGIKRIEEFINDLI